MMNPNEENEYRFTPVVIACSHNPNLQVTKYLIEEQKSPSKTPKDQSQNLLTWSCTFNRNPEVSKYLIEVQKLDPKEDGYLGSMILQ